MKWIQEEGILQNPDKTLNILDIPSFALRRNENDDLHDVTDTFNTGGSGKDPASPFHDRSLDYTNNAEDTVRYFQLLVKSQHRHLKA